MIHQNTLLSHRRRWGLVSGKAKAESPCSWDATAMLKSTSRGTRKQRPRQQAGVCFHAEGVEKGFERYCHVRERFWRKQVWDSGCATSWKPSQTHSFVWRASLLVVLVPISKLETHKSQPPILSYRLVRINPEHQVYALAYMARLLGICLWKRQQLDLDSMFFKLFNSDQGLAAGLYQLLVGVVFCEFRRVKSCDLSCKLECLCYRCYLV